LAIFYRQEMRVRSRVDGVRENSANPLTPDPSVAAATVGRVE
jgi:hypothetical protein